MVVAPTAAAGRESTLQAINYMIVRRPWWGPPPAKGWPDMDFVFTGGQGCGGQPALGRRCPGQTDVEYRPEFSMGALAGGALVFAVEVSACTLALAARGAPAPAGDLWWT